MTAQHTVWDINMAMIGWNNHVFYIGILIGSTLRLRWPVLPYGGIFLQAGSTGQEPKNLPITISFASVLHQFFECSHPKYIA